MNDGDYNHHIFDISEEEFDEKYLHIIDLLKLFGDYNLEKLLKFSRELEEGEHDFEYSPAEIEELCRDIDDFWSLVGGCESYEPHSIESISYCEVPKKEWTLL